MSATFAPTTQELIRLAGPFLVGYILNWGLFGILSMQVYLYYLAFPKDKAGHKAVVYGSYLLESAQTFMFTSSAFRTFATGFGNPSMLDDVDILWFSVPIMSGIVACIVQVFYAYRISVLARTYLVAGIIAVLAVFQLGGALAMGIKTKQAMFFSSFAQKPSFAVTAGIWEGGSVACDLIIAASMLYHLRSQETGFKKSDNLLTRMIRLFIETGTLTAVIAIIALILTFLPGRPMYYQTAVTVLGKVYTNSMMVAFNSRMKIGSVSTSTTAHEVPVPLSIGNNHLATDNTPFTRSGGILITREQAVYNSQSGYPMDTKERKKGDASDGESDHAFQNKFKTDS